MTKAGKSLLEGAKQALKMAKGEIVPGGRRTTFRRIVRVIRTVEEQQADGSWKVISHKDETTDG